MKQYIWITLFVLTTYPNIEIKGFNLYGRAWNWFLELREFYKICPKNFPDLTEFCLKHMAFMTMLCQHWYCFLCPLGKQENELVKTIDNKGKCDNFGMSLYILHWFSWEVPPWGDSNQCLYHMWRFENYLLLSVTFFVTQSFLCDFKNMFIRLIS